MTLNLHSMQVWSRNGWLTYYDISGLPNHKDWHLFGSGMIDFAGSGAFKRWIKSGLGRNTNC